MRVLGHRVLVVPDAMPQATDSGLHLPNQADYQPTSGTVRMVGDGSAQAYRVRQRAIQDCVNELSGRYEDGPLRALLKGREPLPTVRVGQHVIFPAECGLNLELDGQLYVLLNEDDIVIVDAEAAA